MMMPALGTRKIPLLAAMLLLSTNCAPATADVTEEVRERPERERCWIVFSTFDLPRLKTDDDGSHEQCCHRRPLLYFIGISPYKIY